MSLTNKSLEQQDRKPEGKDHAALEAADKLRSDALGQPSAADKYEQIRKEANDGLFLGNRAFFRSGNHLTPESQAGYEKAMHAFSRINMPELKDLIAGEKRQLRQVAETDPKKAEKISERLTKLEGLRDDAVSTRILYAARLVGEGDWSTARRIAEEAVKAGPRAQALDANRQLLEQLGVKVDAGGLEATEMKRTFSTLLPKLDKDKDGRLNKEEILKGALDPNIKGQEAQLLAVLKKHYDQFTGLKREDWWFWDSGISQNDMDKFHESVDEGATDPQMNPVAGEVITELFLSSKTLKEASLNVFGDAKDPMKGICPEAVNQSTELGNCYFMAALASLASSDPNAIKQMISQNGDGSFTVRFPGAKDEPINVKAPTDTELCLFAEANENGYWPVIMEKAFGEYCRKNPLRRSPFNWSGGELPSEGGTGGSATHFGVEILSGRSVELLDKDNPDHLHEQLTAAFRDKSPVTASIHGDVLSSLTMGIVKTPNAHELPMGHEYSILSYDPVSRTVMVRNPWGNTGYKRANGKVEGEHSGTFKLTLDELKQNFTNVAAASRRV
jgi:hypothetical protein